MFLKRKKNIQNLVETICELIVHINNTGNIALLTDIESGLAVISKYLEKENYHIQETKKQLENVCIILTRLKNNKENVTFDDLNELLENVDIFEQSFLIQVQTKLNVVFMPYNINMWDSLESIYYACSEDKDCVATVVPIPYFDITVDPPIKHDHFDRYDKSLNIVNYKEFDLESEEPDIIYVHNIYDNYNTLTSVLPKFYTSNLKKYTDMLVYSPYCLPTIITKEILKNKKSYTFEVGGAKNVDKFISAGDFDLREGLELGYNRGQIINEGSPKFDSIVNKIKGDFKYPENWIKGAEGKPVAVWATPLNYFVAQYDKSADGGTNFANAIMEFGRTIQKFKDEDKFVIWRPHPLTRNFISARCPAFVSWYDRLCKDINDDKCLKAKDYSHVVYDDSESFLPAFAMSDALITKYSSIIYLYMLLNKKYICENNSKNFSKVINIKKYNHKIDFAGEGNFVDKDIMVNFKKTSNIEIDSELLSKFYKNLDGTAGQKIHSSLKSELLGHE